MAAINRPGMACGFDAAGDLINEKLTKLVAEPIQAQFAKLVSDRH